MNIRALAIAVVIAIIVTAIVTFIGQQVPSELLVRFGWLIGILCGVAYYFGYPHPTPRV